MFFLLYSYISGLGLVNGNILYDKKKILPLCLFSSNLMSSYVCGHITM